MKASPRVRTRGRPPAAPAVRRDQLQRAAIDVFLKKGFHATRIEDIVARAQTGKGTFYLHFRDKEDVFGAAIEELFTELQSTLSWVNRSIDPEATLEQIFQQEAARIFQSLLDHQNIGRLALREGRSAGPEVEKKVAAFYRRLLDLSKETLGAAQKMGLLPGFPPEVAAACILGAIEKTFSLWLDGQLSEPPETLMLETLRFLQRGCGLPARDSA